MAPHTHHPAIDALLDAACVEFRAALDAAGEPYTAGEVHTSLYEQMPDIAANTAEQIALLMPGDQDDFSDDENQELFDAVMNAALASIKSLITRMFEEFGPVDEEAFASAWARSQLKLIDRLRALMAQMTVGGAA